MFKGDKLMGDVGDSPVVKDEFSSALFFTTTYRF
jgi:outer membrane scaffolding protein for murein synthesis (MipA/OmpV family)